MEKSIRKVPFYSRLRELRRKNNLTQKGVAQALGCQREVYRRYECGSRALPLSIAISLADMYEISLDYLVGRTDRKVAPARI